jgi:hypothetical protein
MALQVGGYGVRQAPEVARQKAYDEESEVAIHDGPPGLACSRLGKLSSRTGAGLLDNFVLQLNRRAGEEITNAIATFIAGVSIRSEHLATNQGAIGVMHALLKITTKDHELHGLSDGEAIGVDGLNLHAHYRVLLVPGALVRHAYNVATNHLAHINSPQR